MNKDFDQWNELKKKIDNQSRQPLVKQRDIWWSSIGINVGGEICGKNAKATRPVLILQKIFSNLAVVVPLTSQIKQGFWYVPITINHKQVYACIHQIKALDYKRLTVKMCRLDEKDFQLVKNKVARLTSNQEK